MSALFRWFKKAPDHSRRGAVSPDWEEEVAALEAEAKRTARAFRGTPLNKAGDLCLRAGDRERALTFYGRSINALLEDGQREAARGVANKLIRVHPEAVRTLCTLTWLDLASRHMATALLHLRDYVEAAKRGGQERLTSWQIYEMARVAPQEEFLAAAADSLDQLGFADQASEVREWSRSGGSPDKIDDSDELTDHCLSAAVGAVAKPRSHDEPA
jgi:hypothetical protein